MLNVALVGFGYWGPNIARNINNNPNLNLHTICDMIDENLEKAHKIYASSTNYEKDFNKVLEDKTIDIVAIATQTSSHYYLIKQALLAFKNVYVEKPFTATLQEAQELEELAKKQNKIIHIDHIMIFHPAIKKIKEIISSGEIGEVLFINSTRKSLGQFRKDVSSMWDLAVHDLSIIDYLMDGKSPISIKASGDKFYNPKESITFVNLKYENFSVHLESNWLSPIKERNITIVGTKKMLVYEDLKLENKLTVYDKNVEVVSGENITDENYLVKTNEFGTYSPYIKPEDALYNSIEHLRTSIINQTQSLSNPSQAIRVHKILEIADNNMNM
ncbi:Gfo/Idh/MocA family oxidoreductase [Aliarcobacter cryaerophilus]|uniref:Gfo/Idh/MocA family protein n=1 Tax=Aliarcobacter cryaerophilus TaxID=28198 RepID=UPI003DA3B923